MLLFDYRCIAVALLLIALSLCAVPVLRAQQDTMETTLDPVTVRAGMLPAQLRHLTRNVEIIDQESMQSLAPPSIDDALRGFSTAFVQRRGVQGVQSDLAIRGGTFGQTLFLLDGMRVNDPQTGHHGLHVPLPMAMIERLELLPGHGSSLLGADAFGGAVNIVPRFPETMRYGISVEGGSHALRGMTGEAAYGGTTLPSMTAVEYRESDGWREGTAFSLLTFSHLSRLEFEKGRLTLLAGHTDKDFGAFDFYSPGRGIPSHERIRSTFAALTGGTSLGNTEVRASVSLRDFRDRFHFDLRIPDQYINEHHTQVLGATVQGVTALSQTATLMLGVEHSRDRIESSNLGTHERQWIALSAVSQWQALHWLHIDGGLRWDMHSHHIPQFNPSLGAQLMPFDHMTLRVSAGRSFRLPTYTDLYYSDPVNKGNAALQPESAWSAESSVEWRPRETVTLSATVFHRDQRDLIDYVQFTEDQAFFAMNFTQASVTGSEWMLQWRGKGTGALSRAGLSWTAISPRLDTRDALRVRYSFTTPEHLLRLRLGGALPFTVQWMLVAIAADQRLARDYVSIDVRLRKSFGAWEVWMAADNLTNSVIEEFPGLPLPGRWLRFGIGLQFH